MFKNSTKKKKGILIILSDVVVILFSSNAKRIRFIDKIQLKMARFRSELAVLISFLLTLTVVINAFLHKKQFYPSIVYLTKSNSSMAVIYLQAFVFTLIIGKLMNKIFFGQLRAIELEVKFFKNFDLKLKSKI